MSEHYYTASPQSDEERKKIQAVLRDTRFVFWTAASVFSREYVDYGSRLLIETLDVPPGARVLDVGCGYGPIGIAIAKTVADVRVDMVDINERAVALAQENAAANGVADRVRVFVSDGYAQVDGVYDVIVTNPPIRAGKDVVYAIFAGAKEHLVPGGSLWVVIHKKQGAPSAERKLAELYGTVERVARKKGYHVFRVTRGA